MITKTSFTIFSGVLITSTVLAGAAQGQVVSAAGQQGAASQAPAASNTPSPYQLTLVYTGEEWENSSGGLKQGSLYMQNADAKFTADTGKAFGWTGGQFVLEGFYETDVSLGNRLTGALDQQSPIDTAWNKPMYRLYQAYYDQNFGSTDVLFGVHDLETEFSTTKPMTLFLNKNLTWNTALDQAGTMPINGNVGPGNYPYTPLALRVRQDFSKEWSAQFAIADGIADSPYNQTGNEIYFNHKDGALMIGEVDYTPSKYTKIMAGAWDLTAKLPTNNETNPDGSTAYAYNQEGFYVGGTTRLYHAEGNRGLDGFLTLGWSNPTDTNVNYSVNGGLVYTGLLDVRPMDKAGISFNVNRAPGSYQLGQAAGGMPINSTETSIEGTYRAKITDWLTVQPDAEYIVDPNYNPGLKNDFVFGLHFEIGHLFNL